MTSGGYTLLEVPRPKQKLVHIHSSAEELNRVYQADLAINSTMNAAARSLEVLTAPVNVVWEAWAQEANADYLANMQPQPLPGDIDMPAIVATLPKTLAIRRCVDQWCRQLRQLDSSFLQTPRPGERVQDPTGTNGAMGYGVPAGIAANILTGRTAFTIAGDGDFLMNGQELATAVQHGQKVSSCWHVRHDPHAPGTRLPAACGGHEVAKPRLLRRSRGPTVMLVCASPAPRNLKPSCWLLWRDPRVR